MKGKIIPLFIALLLVTSGITIAQSQYELIATYDVSDRTGMERMENSDNIGIYDSASGADQITVYNSDFSSVQETISLSGHSQGYADAFEEHNGKIYTLNNGGYIDVFDSNYNHENSYTVSGFDEGVYDLEFYNGYWYIGDAYRNNPTQTLYKLDQNFNIVETYEMNTGFQAIEISESGVLYGADGNNDRVVIYNNIEELSTTGTNNNIDSFSTPDNGGGITLRENLNILVLNNFDSVVWEYYQAPPPADYQGIELELANQMDPNTTQGYRVIYTNEDRNRVSVTDNTTLQSSNTSIISINSSSNTLVADDVNHSEVTITANYTNSKGNNFITTENVTVAPVTIEYIGILPNTEWVPAVLGYGEPGTQNGLGSEIQFVFFALLIGAFAARVMRNEWVGVGLTTGMLCLFWALEHIGLGIMLTAVFYAIFAAYTLMNIPGRSDTNVGGR